MSLYLFWLIGVYMPSLFFVLQFMTKCTSLDATLKPTAKFYENPLSP